MTPAIVEGAKGPPPPGWMSLSTVLGNSVEARECSARQSSAAASTSFSRAWPVASRKGSDCITATTALGSVAGWAGSSPFPSRNAPGRQLLNDAVGGGATNSAILEEKKQVAFSGLEKTAFVVESPEG